MPLPSLAGATPKLESGALAHKHEDGSDVFRVQDADPRFIISSGLPVTKVSVFGDRLSCHEDLVKGSAEWRDEPAFEDWRDFYETADEPAFDEALRLVEQG